MPAPMPRVPYACIFDSDSKATQPGYYRATSTEQWHDIWRRHRGLAKDRAITQYDRCPEFNFDDCTVVAIFQGRRVNSCGVTGFLYEEPDRLVLRFDDLSYQTGAEGDACSAFGFFLLPKSAKPLALEENTQGLIGRPPIWTPRPWSRDMDM